MATNQNLNSDEENVKKVSPKAEQKSAASKSASRTSAAKTAPSKKTAAKAGAGNNVSTTAAETVKKTPARTRSVKKTDTGSEPAKSVAVKTSVAKPAIAKTSATQTATAKTSATKTATAKTSVAKSVVAKTAAEKKILRSRKKEIENSIDNEAKALIKQRFDYVIPIADIKRAGINSIGIKIENDLIPLLEEFTKYRKENNLWHKPQVVKSYHYYDDGRIMRSTEIDGIMVKEDEPFYNIRK